MTSLDQRINRLLESRPLRPREGFVDDVLAAAEAAEPASSPTSAVRRGPARLLRFALPAAAVLAFALVFSGFFVSGPDNGTGPNTLTTAEVEEILLLQETLPALETADSATFRADGLLQTLEALDYES